MRAGVFVTGTDTGVGKTVVGCTLVRALRARALDVGVMKPCETGVGADGPVDALALSRAAGDPDPIELVCPVRLALPAAPNVAAEHEGRTLDVAALVDGFGLLAARHDFMLVEGAGGLVVPIWPPICMADLAEALALPILVVARTGLGTINHTLLTLSEIARRGLRLVGVVASHSSGRLTPADEANFDHLREILGDRLVGEIPPIARAETASADFLQLDRILARCQPSE
jgi:dethiobiotin synthetase